MGTVVNSVVFFFLKKGKGCFLKLLIYASFFKTEKLKCSSQILTDAKYTLIILTRKCCKFVLAT